MYTHEYACTYLADICILTHTLSLTHTHTYTHTNTHTHTHTHTTHTEVKWRVSAVETLAALAQADFFLKKNPFSLALAQAVSPPPYSQNVGIQ